MHLDVPSLQNGEEEEIKTIQSLFLGKPYPLSCLTHSFYIYWIFQNVQMSWKKLALLRDFDFDLLWSCVFGTVMNTYLWIRQRTQESGEYVALQYGPWMWLYVTPSECDTISMGLECFHTKARCEQSRLVSIDREIERRSSRDTWPWGWKEKSGVSGGTKKDVQHHGWTPPLPPRDGLCLGTESIILGLKQTQYAGCLSDVQKI